MRILPKIKFILHDLLMLSEKADLVIELHDNLLLGSDEHDFFLKDLSEPDAAEPSERPRAPAERYQAGN